jgi:hypothetical protein
MDLEANDNKVVGQVTIKGGVGKRTIWFNYHVIGRLEGDPFADKSSSVASLFPGGYVEAIGGRFYELGQPMMLEEWGQKQTNAMTNKQENIVTDTVKGGDMSSTGSPWWLPGSTAAVSALLSSTILSACIGYGAGLSMIQDSSYHHETTASKTVVAGPSQNSGIKMLPPSSSSKSVLAVGVKSSTLSDANQKPSVEELRARAQYRVLREERLLNKISQRLEIDKQELKQLEEQEEQSSRLLP